MHRAVGGLRYLPVLLALLAAGPPACQHRTCWSNHPMIGTPKPAPHVPEQSVCSKPQGQRKG
eukprot:581716-Rhodomonas_salina.1